jgi:hypothetical protein
MATGFYGFNRYIWWHRFVRERAQFLDDRLRWSGGETQHFELGKTPNAQKITGTWWIARLACHGRNTITHFDRYLCKETEQSQEEYTRTVLPD